MKRWILVTFLMLLFVKVEGDESVFVLSIPKSGTFLIGKYINLVQEKVPNSGLRFCPSHLSEVESGLPKGFFRENPETKKIIMIRDLRDVFCSSLNHINNRKHYLQSSIDFDSKWYLLSQKEQLIQVIDYSRGSRKDFYWSYHGKSIPQKLHDFIARAIEYSKYPNTCVVRFENLVGPNGGGSKEAMRCEMKMINDFLDFSLEDEQYADIMSHLFGGTMTFNKGHMNRWKDEFDDELKELFKQWYGQELIDLGYEKDFNW
ncbi:MAG: hypothetical protein KR126chlam1_00946 [Chlamydiae bacterium]|nr:hypothetical protein [Chlamydiota bacterium]